MTDRLHTLLGITIAAALPALAVAEHTTLPEVVVEAEAIEQPEQDTVRLDPSNAPSSVDSATLLKKVAGADTISLGPLSGIAQYRGMAADRVNVSVGGFQIKDVGPDGMSPTLSNLPGHLTHSLTVYRGIAPVRSGMETIGGAIEAEAMKGRFAEADRIEFHGASSMGYTSVNNGWSGSLAAQVANRSHRFELSGSREEGANYKFEGDKAVTPSRYGRDAYSVAYGYRSQAGDELGLDYMNHDTGPTGTPSLPMDILFIRGGVNGINYVKDLGNGVKLETSLHYQNMRHRMDNFTLRPAIMQTDYGPHHMTHDSTTSVEGGGENVTLTLPWYSGTLKVGFNGDQSRHNMTVNNAMPTMGMNWVVNSFHDVERDRYSLFADWDGKLDERWKLNLGLRYTYVRSQAGRVFDTRTYDDNVAELQDRFNNGSRFNDAHNVDAVAVLRHALNDELTLEFGLARKNRAPSYLELFLWQPDHATGGLADGKLYMGDPNLRPEKSYQTELGLEWHTPRFHLSPRAFYHYVNDYIQGIPSTDPAVIGAAAMHTLHPLQYANVDAHLFGSDLDWGYAIDDHWHLDGTLSYVRGKRLDRNDNLYRMTPLHGNVQLSYHRSRWMASVETVAYASQGDVSHYNDEVKTPGFVLFNLRGEYEPLDGLKLNLGVENLLDKENRNHLAGLNQVYFNGNLPVGARMPGRGRNFYANLSYAW
ncbi:MAG: TonB-dependent receptor [Methylococcaceae bacterium]|nr:TonB-dependent receptor [Methylococcaceae bacterium]